MKIHIIITVYQRIIPLKRLIYEILLQTNQDWTMHIIHDGPAFKSVSNFITSLKDPRITFEVTPQANGKYGFPNRDIMLQKIKGEPGDYILFTNDDNQYLQVALEYFLRQCNEKVGFVYCNCIHNYFRYDVLISQIKVRYIDIGSFIVRLDVAKKVGFSSYAECADGTYAEECAAECKKRGLMIIKINKALFIHN
jgi:hypothetical protein